MSVVDTNNLTVSALSSGANQAVSLVSGGTLTLPATAINTGTAALTLQSNGGSLATAGNLSGDDITLVGSGGVSLGHNVAATDALQVSTTNNAVTQTAGTVSAGGATTVNAGTGNVTLAQGTNDLNSIAVTGGAVSVTDQSALVLGAISATSLTVNTNGEVTQTAAATVTGTTTVNAGTGNVTLAQGTNDFNSIALTGGAVSVTDQNALVLGAVNASSLTVNVGGPLTQNASATVGGTTNINAGSNEVVLNQTGNDFGSDLSLSDSQRRVDIVAGSVNLTDSNQLVLGDIVVANNAALPNQVLNVESGFIPSALPSTNNSQVGLPGQAGYANTQAVLPDSGQPLNLSNSAISQASGTTIQTGTAVASTFTASEGGSITLTGNNQMAGAVNALSGRAFNAEFTYDAARGASVVSIVNRGTLAVGNQGIEADLVAIEADGLTTASTGEIRARLPYSVIQPASQQLPGLLLSLSTFDVLTMTSRLGNLNLSFGSPSATANPKDGGIKINVGTNNPILGSGGFVTVRPKDGAVGQFAGQVVYLQGPDISPNYRFVYDGVGDKRQIPVVYNGFIPLAPAEAGTLSSVLSTFAEVRREVFASSVRTENVAVQINNGVIVEVGPGKPALEGVGQLTGPETCSAVIVSNSLQCD